MDVRAVTDEELAAFIRTDHIGFGVTTLDEHLDDARGYLELDRTVAVFDGDDIAATAAAFSFELTVPGLTVTPAAGITWVSVLPTHRRRGLLRRMMAHQLDDVAARGEAVAILTASEATIYGRFGYGCATWTYDVKVQRARSALRSPVADDGRVRIIDAETARKVLPPVFDRSRRLLPADHQRADSFWNYWFTDRERWREGASARFYAVHETAAGEADGYVAYRVKQGWSDHGVPNGEVVVGDLATTTPTSRAALWQYLFGVDLTDRVQAHIPLDEPLRWLLADARAIEVNAMVDDIWCRVLDVEAALSTRGYAADGRLVLEVVDEFRPQAGGCFLLDGGRCTRTDAEPDLHLPVDALGSIYLGGVLPSALAAAGRITELKPGALAVADAMFPSPTAPFSQTHF
ncbi:MAG TPA: GNAT family N-acetyltransferase [Acidimicrobiales bacterium]|nr:GNAT family N-acetyltransferase [Acidimicrobiales bacterium]